VSKLREEGIAKESRNVLNNSSIMNIFLYVSLWFMYFSAYVFG